MSPAEFDTRRRALGLSVDETASFFGVQDRTVRRWQAGASPIPEDAADKLDQLEAAMGDAVDHAVAIATDAMSDGQIVLWRYRNAQDQSRSPHAASLPLGAHAMLIAWTFDALTSEGFDVAIAWAA